MKGNSKRLIWISLIIFFIGYLLGMVILGISVIGDFEAFMFKPTIDGKSLLTTLKCPVMMSSSETGTIAVTLSNPVDSRISPTVWTYISAGFVTLIREERENLILEPGDSQQLQWTILPESAAFGGHWALVKIYVASQYPLPSSDAVCGVFVADMLGFTGAQVHIFSMTLSGLLMAIGIGMYARAIKPLKRATTRNLTSSLITFGVLVLLGLISTIIGSYLLFLSALFFIISFMTVISFLLFQNHST